MNLYPNPTAPLIRLYPKVTGRGKPVAAKSHLVRVVRLQLLLQREQLLVSLVQPRRERDHDVTLLKQNDLVAIHLRARWQKHTAMKKVANRDGFKGRFE